MGRQTQFAATLPRLFEFAQLYNKFAIGVLQRKTDKTVELCKAFVLEVFAHSVKQETTAYHSHNNGKHAECKYRCVTAIQAKLDAGDAASYSNSAYFHAVETNLGGEKTLIYGVIAIASIITYARVLKFVVADFLYCIAVAEIDGSVIYHYAVIA